MLSGIQTFFALLFLVALVFLAGRLLVVPLKWILKLGYNTLLGLIFLWLFNLIGNIFGISLPVNIFTVLITGFLGVPGLILLIILRLLLG